jgi:LysM repeat protein
MSVQNREIQDKAPHHEKPVTSDHLSAAQNAGTSPESRASLLDQARAKFERSGHNGALDMSGMESLYGSHQIGVPREHKHQHGKEHGKEDNDASAGSKSVEVKHGDSLWKIAKHDLGGHASASEIMQHVRDIAKLNGMQDPFRHGDGKADVIHPGQRLKLPGDSEHTPNNGEDPNHKDTVRKGDTAPAPVPPPDLRHDDHPRPAPEKAPGPEPKKDVPPEPPKPVPPPELKKDVPPEPPKPVPPPELKKDVPPEPPKPVPPPELKKDVPPEPPKPVPSPELKKDVPPQPDKVEKAPEKGDKQGPQTETDKLEQEKQRLDKNIENLPPADKARIQDNMKEFEKRAQTDNLPPDEVRKTYEQANRLYDSKNDQPIAQADKQVLADQILAHAAHPHNIDQGQHSTCNVTAEESRLFSRSPSEAAQVIADVGTTGSYTAKDGTKVTLNATDFAKDRESSNNPPIDGERSYASKLFQETAINLHYAASGERYVETPGVPGDRASFGKDKEEIISPNGDRRPFDGFGIQDVSKIDGQITGKTDSDHFLSNYDNSSGIIDNWGKVNTFHTEDQFKSKLADLKERKEFPVVMFVDARKPPFAVASAEGAGGGGGGHVVTITDYDPKTGKVSYANQWGTSNNHTGPDNGVDVDTMYKASQLSNPQTNWSSKFESWVAYEFGN